MRLGNKMSDDRPVPEEVEAELDAIEAALRGDEVPAGMEGLEALVSDLRAERREPEPRFEAELDAWAAAGFPRGQRPGTKASGDGPGTGASGFFSRFGAGGARGWAPLAATAATLVVVAVSITQVGDFGGGESDLQTQDVSGEPASPGVTSAQGDGSREDPREAEASGGSVAPTEDALVHPESAGGAFDEQKSLPDAVLENKERDIDGFARDDRGTALYGGLDQASRTGINRGQDKRRVDRDAELTLAAPADDVPEVANQVIDVTEGANGVVLDSRVSGNAGSESARATLELQVPSSTLDETLAQLSELADVRSRSEQAIDITRTYVSAKDRLVGLRAERDNLAARIRAAATDAEVASLTAQLAAVNRQIADAKSELARVTNRAQLSTVSVVVTSEGASDGDGDGGWSFGDALGDAGRVLEVVAGVALISAAVLVSLAIIAAIAYVIVASANRRARERALDK